MPHSSLPPEKTDATRKRENNPASPNNLKTKITVADMDYSIKPFLLKTQPRNSQQNSSRKQLSTTPLSFFLTGFIFMWVTKTLRGGAWKK